MHVDMDAFFVSVELRTRPELQGKMVIVGHPEGRSVVLSASYEARARGVRSAMPMSTALRACPNAVVIAPQQQLYRQVSYQVMEVFRSITDTVEQLSVDEAFLDISGSLRRLGTPLEIGAQIRTRIAAELGITASVGIAASKFVAKVASTRCKPNGMLLIEKARTVEYLHTLPAEALWGVGAKTAQTLARLGIFTVADIAGTPVSALQKALGSTGASLHALSWGLDGRAVTPERQEKSIGAEETFAVDTHDDELLTRELLRLSHRVAARLREAELSGRTVALKVKYADFSTISRSRTLGASTDSAANIYTAAVGLLKALGPRGQLVRLVGVRVEKLEALHDAPLQLSLDPRDGQSRSAEVVGDAIAARFGSAKIGPARLLKPRD
ncbi:MULTISPECIES: DNA polymerase IV [Arthrobacter]|uniref:DNA polymerase IV n=1 Tax=Arthrobacter psychrochitiniphilus TaxID=291045 RepID=A0A2V3DTL4_9MICC|nr:MULTISPECIES: DNA polymerase IV [Arthrobacter]PXA65615.1 DNA polymerase IV [Arthrobacter psychrochitiniphilus]